MRKQKPRNALVAPDNDFIDLGVLNMTPVTATEEAEPEEDESEFDVVMKVLEPKMWATRNRVIVRNP
jgi:hypothetical protein